MERIDEHGVHPPAAPVHADPYPCTVQHVDEGLRGEPAALVGIEGFWPLLAGQGFSRSHRCGTPCRCCSTPATTALLQELRVDDPHRSQGLRRLAGRWQNPDWPAAISALLRTIDRSGSIGWRRRSRLIGEGPVRGAHQPRRRPRIPPTGRSRSWDMKAAQGGRRLCLGPARQPPVAMSARTGHDPGRPSGRVMACLGSALARQRALRS